MRDFTLIGASAFVLVLGVTAAAAEPFNPVTGYGGPYIAPSYGYNGSLIEGRSGPDGAWSAGNPILQQFHEGNGGQR